MIRQSIRAPWASVFTLVLFHMRGELKPSLDHIGSIAFEDSKMSFTTAHRFFQVGGGGCDMKRCLSTNSGISWT